MVMAGRSWAAAATAGVAGAVELLVVLVILGTTPTTLFRPSLYGVLLVVPPLIALVAAGILLVAERYSWAITVLAVHRRCTCGGVFDPGYSPRPIGPASSGFHLDLMLIGFLLSLEWFTRKMLRLA